MNIKKLPIIIALVFIAMVILASGIYFVAKGSKKIAEVALEKVAEKTIEKETGSDTEIDFANNEFSFEQDGQKVAYKVTTQLPADFRKDIPVFKDSELTGVGNISSDNGEALQAFWTTGEALDAVMNFFETKLEENGWSMTGNFNTAEGGTIVAEKDGSTLVMGAAKQEDKVSISISVTKN